MLLLNFLIFSVFAFCSSTIILPAKQSTDKDVGIIFVPGASIESKLYTKFFESLQSKYPGLWVAITEFTFSTPNPLQLEGEIKSGLDNLKKSGFQHTKDTPFFFVGHSLGGVFLQDYILNKDKQSALPIRVAGLVLEGSYVVRKNYDLVKSGVLPGILTIGGELDGLNRISRMAESLYFDIKNVDKNVQRLTRLIPGMNHYQFAGEGNPPSNVRNNDITAEITNEEACDKATEILSAFMKVILKTNTEEEPKILNQSLTITKQLADPLIEAFIQEGSYHFNTPCYTLDKPEGSGCTQGSPWSEHAQKIMGGQNVSMQVTDSFHPVYQINPVHLPDIHNKCDTPFDCTLNVTTVSQLLYSTFDSQDVSLFSSAASEIKVKLMSRQSVLLKATGITYDLKETDGGNKCADINQDTIDWAIRAAPKQVLTRYLKSNKQLRVGDDIGPLNVGPLWIWTFLEFNNKKDDKGQGYVELKAPMMNTPVDYPIAAARGFHYCKVLSPARALEWIYIDSIKP